jgi:hypothetical protein
VVDTVDFAVVDYSVTKTFSSLAGVRLFRESVNDGGYLAGQLVAISVIGSLLLSVHWGLSLVL